MSMQNLLKKYLEEKQIFVSHVVFFNIIYSWSFPLNPIKDVSEYVYTIVLNSFFYSVYMTD